MTKVSALFYLCSIAAPSVLFASDDVSSKLKANIKNSRHNAIEFEKAVKTANDRIHSLNSSLKRLESIRTSAVIGQKDSQSAQLNLTKQKQQFIEAIQKEKAALNSENRYLVEIKNHLGQLNTSIEQRKSNIQHYETQNKKIDQELNNWKNQKSDLTQLNNKVNQQIQEVNSSIEYWKSKKKNLKLSQSDWQKKHQESVHSQKEYKALKALQGD